MSGDTRALTATGERKDRTMDIGPLEIALIVVAIVLIFGVGKLGDIGGALGKSIREFRHERDKADDLLKTAEDTKNSKSVPPLEGELTKRRLCPACGEAAHERANFA